MGPLSRMLERRPTTYFCHRLYILFWTLFDWANKWSPTLVAQSMDLGPQLQNKKSFFSRAYREYIHKKTKKNNNTLLQIEKTDQLLSHIYLWQHRSRLSEQPAQWKTSPAA